MWIVKSGVLGFIVAAVVSGLIADYVIVDLYKHVAQNGAYLVSLVANGSYYWWGVPVLLLSMLLVGCLAFSLRQHAPDIYGGLEVGFGSVSAALALMQFIYSSINPLKASEVVPDSAKYLFAFAGALYVIVRGLDNAGKDVMSPNFPEGRFKGLWAWCFSKKPARSTAARKEPRIG